MMSVSAAEILTLLKGQASGDLQERFLREVDKPNSELAGVLRGMEDWCRKHLNPLCPAPFAPAAPTVEPEYRVLRKAGFVENRPAAVPRVAGVSDLIACCRGTATAETAALVREALDNPASELSKALNQLQTSKQ